MHFDNLHLTENYTCAVKSLKGSSGVYCVINQETGGMYIGSSINLGRRLADHATGEGSNAHLQFAIAKYGLALFTFSVIERRI
jgi:group I intron endonuclease